MDNRIAGMMGCFWREEVPIMRLSPFLVRFKVKLLNDSRKTIVKVKKASSVQIVHDIIKGGSSA